MLMAGATMLLPGGLRWRGQETGRVELGFFFHRCHTYCHCCVHHWYGVLQRQRNGTLPRYWSDYLGRAT